MSQSDGISRKDNCRLVSGGLCRTSEIIQYCLLKIYVVYKSDHSNSISTGGKTGNKIHD